MMDPDQEYQEMDRFEERAREIIQRMDADLLASILREYEALEQQVSTPEAVGSCNAFITTPLGAKIQVTSRGASLEYSWGQLVDFIKRRLKEGCSVDGSNGTYKQQPAQQQPVQQQPAQQQPAQQQPAQQVLNANGKEYRAEKLSVEMKNGKYYYAVTGGQFTQFGVRIWPEVLQSIGIDVKDNPVPDITDLSGYIATYIEGPSRSDPLKIVPQKVVSLRKA